MHLKHNILLIRKLLKETQPIFAARFTGVTLGMQKSYEAGTPPSLLYMQELAKLSGVTQTDLQNKELDLSDIKVKKEKPGTVGHQADELAEARAEAREANAAIRGHLVWMEKMAELNFSVLLSKQEGEIGIVIEILKLGARLESKGNPDKEREILAESLRRIGPDLSPKMKEDIAADGSR